MKTSCRLFSKFAVLTGKAYGYCLVASFLLFIYIPMLVLFPKTTTLQHHTNDYLAEATGKMTFGLESSPGSQSYSILGKPITQLNPAIAAKADQGIAETTVSAPSAFSSEIKQQYGGIPKEYVLRFNSLEELRDFLKKARECGLEILGFNEKLLSIRFHAESFETYGDLFSDISPANLEQNGEVFTPDIFNLDQAPSLAGYAGFGRGALAWLGLKDRAGNWGDGVVVAVLDTKIEPHPALEGTAIRYFNLLPVDTVTDTGEYAGHGTAVASIIAGNDGLIQGIAPMSKLLAISVLDGNGLGDTFTLAEGILTAVDNGANLINMSLGSYADSATLRQAIDYALNKGVVVVAATGNDGLEQVMYPAGYEGVISVGAVDALEQHLAFSNSGKVDIAAPGYEVQTAWTNGQYAEFSGTSAASPFVAGTIAGMISENRGLSIKEAANIVLAQTNDTGAPGRDDQFGNGILSVERIQRRNASGIYDLAVAGYYLSEPAPPTANEAMPLGVTIENRGTEDIGQAEVEISINGKVEKHTLTNLLAGASVGIDTSVPRDTIGADGVVVVSAKGRIIGRADQKSSNDIRLEDLIFVALQPASRQ